MSSPNRASAHAGALALAGLLAVAIATLWPFRFSFRPLTWADYVHSFGLAPRTLLDLPRNVLLFMPLSLGVAGLLRRRGASSPRVIATTVGSAAALTLAVESLQVFLPGRTPNLSDLAGNVAGAVAALVLLRATDTWSAERGRARRPLIPASAVLLAATLVMAIALSWGLMRGMRPGGWNASALWVADQGVRDVLVLDRAVDGRTIERLLAGELPGELGASAVARLQATPAVVDGVGARIDATGQFTVVFTADPIGQPAGPARLLALRGRQGHDDLALARDEGRLTVAWRSPLTDGYRLTPELAFPNAFDAGGPVRIVLTVDGTTARLRTSTGSGSDDLFLAPDVIFSAIVRETNLWPVSVRHPAFWASTLLFASIVFLPAGALLAVWRRNTNRRVYLLLAGCAFPAVYFEAFISGYRHAAPRPLSVAVGMAVTAVGFGLAALWRQTAALTDDPDVSRG